MKHIIFFLAIFGALLANAQEMDTTFVVNEQGQTVGIVHEKGTVPVMPGQQQQQPNYVQAQPVQQANPVFGYDSTAYYQSLIDRYTQSGRGMRRAGNGMMIGGGIATGVGIAMMVAGFASAVDNCVEDSYYDDYCEADGGDAAMVLVGYLATFAGAAVFTTGAVVKIVGGTKLRRAERYEDKLNSYKMRQQYSLQMRVVPVVDPINNVFGGQLAFNF
ncbi:MAG: hypothetical protein IK012_00040 [Fibrobacter sp.]|uniref:hypothetical protein n=1 Tax=Fibrobacter sp. TaxID=35828 RepID=UPI0025B7BC17|nr:hypothetical protein [Fibrobacter sp.]MBR4783634.1 hypothetical protein [Fibrobacter sp.]